jgi:hypothetical protein
VRTSTYAFRTPVVESADVGASRSEIAGELANAGVEVVVVQAWPPGARALLEECSRRGIETRVLLHSSMAQHGTDPGEGRWASTALEMADAGELGGVGFVKSGLAEAFAALGLIAFHVPNRVPVLPPVDPADLGPGTHVGVMLDPYWRKNVTTQIAAAATLGGTAHVLAPPDVPYLDRAAMVVHGEVPWDRSLQLLAAMTVNLNVTLSESHPMTPMESYLLGVPCLISPTSELFAEDQELAELTTAVNLDNPAAIAADARRLLERRDFAIERGRAWMEDHDPIAAERFAEFTS